MVDDELFSPNGVTESFRQARDKLGFPSSGTQSSPAAIARVAVRSFSDINNGQGGFTNPVNPHIRLLRIKPLIQLKSANLSTPPKPLTRWRCQYGINMADQPLKDPIAIREHYKTYARRHRIPNKQNPCTD